MAIFTLAFEDESALEGSRSELGRGE